MAADPFKINHPRSHGGSWRRPRPAWERRNVYKDAVLHHTETGLHNSDEGIRGPGNHECIFESYVIRSLNGHERAGLSSCGKKDSRRRAHPANDDISFCAIEHETGRYDVYAAANAYHTACAAQCVDGLLDVCELAMTVDAVPDRYGAASIATD